MQRIRRVLGTVIPPIVLCLVIGAGARAQETAAQGDPARGVRDFRVCARCNALEPDRNMTGPSLAGVWGRRAGGFASFDKRLPNGRLPAPPHDAAGHT